MTTINLITPPDKIFNDTEKLLLIYPNSDLENELQTKVLNNLEDDLDLYMFNQKNPTDSDIDWLLTAVNLVDTIVVDVDNCDSQVRMLLGYILAKSKTYWLTNAENSVYNHLSRKRIYNLDNIQIGGISV